MAPRWIFAMLVQFLLLLSLVEALDISYCAPDNTGSGFQLVRSLYQSNGACQDTCSSKYAFAVIQGQSCWCSNYAPGYSVNTLNCKDPCPGYPIEWCGSPSSGLYAYFQLTLSPSGTSARSSARPAAKSSNTPDTSVSGPLTTESPSMHTFPGPSESSHTSSEVEAPTSTPPVLTVITTQTIAQVSSEQLTVTVTEPAPSPSPSSSEPSIPTEVVDTTIEKTATLVATTLATSPTTPSPAPTQAPSLVPFVITVTQNGTTITSTASVTSNPDAVFGQASPPPNGSNAGKIAGIAIGAAVGLAIILGLAFWLYLRRRGRGQFLPGTPESDVGDVDRRLPTRHASQMSQAGLIDKNPRVITTGLPTGSNPHSAGTGFSQNQNYRYSAPTDLRLNPSLLYAQVTAQHSSVSLQDNRDYSRQLHIRNPDT